MTLAYNKFTDLDNSYTDEFLFKNILLISESFNFNKSNLINIEDTDNCRAYDFKDNNNYLSVYIDNNLRITAIFNNEEYNVSL